MLISRQMQREMTKSLFLVKLRLACKNHVPGHVFMETSNVDMDHTKPLGGLGGLEMEMKGALFKFSSVLPGLIRPYFCLFDFIWACLGQISTNKVK